MNAGKGYGTVSIAGGRIITQGDRADGSFVIAYDPKNGSEVWATRNAPVYPNTRGGGPRGTPTIDGDLTYAVSGAGDVICVESATGKKVWGFNMFEQFQGKNPHWGCSESPLVEKDLLIITPGGKVATVAALEKKTGKPVWLAAIGDPAGYSSAVACDAGGVRQVVAVTAKSVIGVSAADGKVLWRYTGTPKGSALNGVANIASPIVRGDHVFFSSNYGAGAVLLKIEKDGEGLKATEVYFTKAMQNHHATSLLLDDRLYGTSGNPTVNLVCMKFLTGEVVYPKDEERRTQGFQKSGIVFADGRIYCLGEEGEAALAEANPEKLVVRSKFQAFPPKP